MNTMEYQLASVLESPIISEKSTNVAEKYKQFVSKYKNKQLKNKLKVL